MMYNKLEKDCRDCIQCFINFMGPWCKKSGEPKQMSHSFWNDVRSCRDFTTRAGVVKGDFAEEVS